MGQVIQTRDMGNVKIVVAAHKPYWMPSDGIYLPVQVGATGKEDIPGFQRDDEGDNISTLNPHYCELTGLYWAWKNLDVDYVGLAHYRRHFAGAGDRKTITSDELRALLAKDPVVLPKRRHYYIETIEAHYGHTFDPTHIEIVRMVLNQLASDYLPAFDAHMQKRSAHILNMFVMRRDILDAYCSWLFPVLELVDTAIDYTGMTTFEARAVGRLAERLLDPWIEHNGIDYVECPLVGMEKTNWLKKGGSFLGAKLFGKKYQNSF